VATANTLQLKASLLGCFGQVCGQLCGQLCTDCYFAASDQNFDIAIRFSDPYFLKESNNFAVRRRLHAVIVTFDTWPEEQCHRLLL